MDVPEEEVTLLLPAGRLPLLLLPSSHSSPEWGLAGVHRKVWIYWLSREKSRNKFNFILSCPIPSHRLYLLLLHCTVYTQLSYYYYEQLWSLKRNNQSLPQFLLLYCEQHQRSTNLFTIISSCAAVNKTFFGQDTRCYHYRLYRRPGSLSVRVRSFF